MRIYLFTIIGRERDASLEGNEFRKNSEELKILYLCHVHKVTLAQRIF